MRYLCNQYISIDGQKVPLFAGVFGIFGHGNVTCLSEALEAVQDRLPTWRGQNEQSMTLAAIAFAKAKRRRQIMVATSSIGPGATNMVTAAALAHANRLPVLILSGDVFANRRPDPVLQQVEHFGAPSTTVNDAFRAVSRYWDRITHPEQILSSLPQAVATMLSPADCGPAFIGLCQDTQEIAFDYPDAFFAPRLHRIPRPRPDAEQIAQGVALIKAAKRPLFIAGGGTRYADAQDLLGDMAMQYGAPVAETIAGKGSLLHDHPALIGPIGVIGSTSANEIAAQADLIVAVGTRLQDFTTGSWTLFDHEAKFLSINAARFDATKHGAIAICGDAREALKEINSALKGHRVEPRWTQKARDLFAKWNDFIDAQQSPSNAQTPSYAQVVGAINRLAGKDDHLVTAAGGLPGEVNKGWRVKKQHSFDCEFGFSCMGYEIAGGWGHAMALPKGATPIVVVGDGSYMMMNSDIWSSVLSGHKMIVVVCDNGGYAVINRLQNFKGVPSFNNLIEDCRIENNVPVDFVKHAESMGAQARRVQTISELNEAFVWAQSNRQTTVIAIDVEPYTWTGGDAAWDVGVPEVSERQSVNDARKEHDAIRARQRIGV